MSRFELKTKAIKIYDYKDVDLSQFIDDIEIDQDKLEESLERFCGNYAEMISADTVVKRDLVTFSSKSNHSRYQKSSATIRVGLGLMGKDFESLLIGLSKNEKKNIQVGDKEVEIVIENIQRELIPELNQALINKTGREDITSVEDVIELCMVDQLAEEIEGIADEALSFVGQTAIENSQFNVDPDEVDLIFNLDWELCAGMIERNQSAKDESAEDTVSEEEIKANIRKMATSAVQMAALECALMEEQGQKLGEIEYKQYIAKKADALGVSSEDLEKTESPTLFLLQEYADRYFGKLEKYVLPALVKLKKRGAR